ncbi:hypothetical protein [Amycolatopsis thermoflava]|uniref:hypothetical protein n=1 Tax=Amycolatopsis thermoflava TaxID=84480 RepID=UPI003EBF45A3
MSSKFKTRQLPIQEITPGHVVQGLDGDWWRVTETDVHLASRTVVLYVRSESTNKPGRLNGEIGALRTVRR